MSQQPLNARAAAIPELLRAVGKLRHGNRVVLVRVIRSPGSETLRVAPERREWARGPRRAGIPAALLIGCAEPGVCSLSNIPVVVRQDRKHGQTGGWAARLDVEILRR
jgi:hypothetical protein